LKKINIGKKTQAYKFSAHNSTNLNSIEKIRIYLKKTQLQKITM